MTAPDLTPTTLDAAVEAAARAYAASMGLDLDNLCASAAELDTDEDVTAWRANLIDSALIVLAAALPILAAGHADQLAQAHAAGTAEGAAAERERIAVALEVAYGYRCPECGGKAGFTAANSGRTWSGCGAGHTWTPPSAPLDVHKAAAIARAGTSGDAT